MIVLCADSLVNEGETNMANWNVERARKLYDEGKPLPEIAHMVGVTRNALLGMKRRQNWPKRAMDDAAFDKHFGHRRTGKRPHRAGGQGQTHASGPTLPPLPSLS